jgi:peptidoglycan-N-acetylglucosamine deacetylase
MMKGPTLPARSFGSARSGVGKHLALSFDDGPGPLTPAILDVLGDYGAHATFFLVGREIAARGHVVRRIADEGHELGNHTFSHKRAGDLSEDELCEELRATSDLIEQVAASRPRLARPPYGSGAAVVVPIASSLGMTTVLWSADPRDWDGKSADAIALAVLQAAEPDAVVVLHDGGGDRTPTLQALRMLIPELHGRGYSLITMSELLDCSRRARRRVIPHAKTLTRLLARVSHRAVAESGSVPSSLSSR